MREALTTANTPASSLPFSQGIICSGRLLYVSGQGPVDPATGSFVTESFEQQCELTLQNLRAVVESAGATLAQVVKVNAYLSDWKYRDAFNRVYARHFPEPRPARTTSHSTLPGFDIEIDCIVALDS